MHGRTHPAPSATRLPRLTTGLTLALLLASSILTTGCSSGRAAGVRQATLDVPAAPGLTSPQPVEAVQALCTIPAGWKPEPLKKTDKHHHQVWLSPSGHTAYGVIHFSLPLPVGPDMVLPFFMKAMKKTEGEAILQSKRRDPELPGIRFVAEGGLYKTYTNLITDGYEGWAVYAGTLRNQETDAAELDLARQAREHTRVGLPATPVAEIE